MKAFYINSGDYSVTPIQISEPVRRVDGMYYASPNGPITIVNIIKELPPDFDARVKAIKEQKEKLRKMEWDFFCSYLDQFRPDSSK